jgi:hypothetical protein
VEAMHKMLRVATLGAIVLTVGCDIPDRVSRLEKDEQELKAELAKNRTAADFDFQAKCSRDATVWFSENWSRDKDTLLLTFSNHYNRAKNKCFILVEYHYSFGRGDTWMNDQTLWDIYENSKYANFSQSSTSFLVKDNLETRESVPTCEVYGKKCTTQNEFSGLVRPYMND